MAKIYYRKIKAGQMTIDDVPDRWKDAVQAFLDADECRRCGAYPYRNVAQKEICKRQVVRGD